MTVYEYIKSIVNDKEKIAELIDAYGAFDNNPWITWWDANYCQKCEPEKIKLKFDDREHDCAYCEKYDKCRFFQELEEVPNSFEIVKLWLNSNVKEYN